MAEQDVLNYREAVMNAIARHDGLAAVAIALVGVAEEINAGTSEIADVIAATLGRRE